MTTTAIARNLATPDLAGEIRVRLNRFVNWLDSYGETSYDHQSFFASNVGRRAKALYYRKPLLGTAAVAPIIFCEAFVPSARALFWKKQRFPIADAHYAMGFAFLHSVTGEDGYYKRAVHFLEVLKQSRCPGFKNYAWGYPFSWETRTGTMKEGTPMITSVPYMYEAFRAVYQIDKQAEWLDIMRSIADHAFGDYFDYPTSADASSCSYIPSRSDPGGVVNASAYRSFLLTQASVDFSEPKYRECADRNVRFVLQSQNQDGSWFYSMDGARDFVDHFHTCFVLKALAKIEAITKNVECTNAITRGVEYYTLNLFDEHGLPKPFSKAPRLTVYQHELYDYAECINVALLLRGRYKELDGRLAATLKDLLSHWSKRDGSWRSRKLLLCWDDIPMHRWAQSQLFRSLTLYVLLASQTGR